MRIACVLIVLAAGWRAPAAEVIREAPGWPTVFELGTGESLDVLGRRVKLVSVEHEWEPDFHIAANAARRTIRAARVAVEVDGRAATLLCRAYESPREVSGLLLYAEVTRAWATATELEQVEGVKGDVRFSAVAAGRPWGPAMVFPIRDYRWRASSYNNTWRSLVPYNRLYYHAGEDLGAIPDRLAVVAPWAGEVVATPLPKGDGKSNGLIVRTPDGVSVRLAHMNIESIDPRLVVGAAVEAGQVLGKTGMTWSGRRAQTHDPHLHTGFKFGPGEGTAVSPFPYFTRAYFDAYPDALMPMAGGYVFALPGEAVGLDGSRSLARPGRRITGYRWRLSDGREVEGAEAEVKYARPGLYAEELIVRADDGSEDRDFAQVRVWRGERAPEPVAYGWVHYWPVRGVKAGTEVLFWNRLVKTVGEVRIDYGDGVTESIVGERRHAYAKAGVYTVTLSGQGPAQTPVVVKTRVVVE